MITEPAPAKINLALHIRAKRPDGYHDLETLFAFARDGDVIRVSEADADSFTITGPFALALGAAVSSPSTPAKAGARDRVATHDGSPSDDLRNRAPAFAGVESGMAGTNLIERARDAFRTTFGCPAVAISLEKYLPIASGIGGGSADAAATLRALARLTGTNLVDPRLFAIAACLGADVPACLLGRTAYATGRGDHLQPLASLGDLPLLLVNPRVPLSTATMFGAWDGIDRGALAGDGTALDRARAGRNDFTAPAIAQAPVVAAALAMLNQAEGCTFARLSGSGATCFGLFADESNRDSAAAVAQANGWWILRTFAV